MTRAERLAKLEAAVPRITASDTAAARARVWERLDRLAEPQAPDDEAKTFGELMTPAQAKHFAWLRRSDPDPANLTRLLALRCGK